MWKKAPNRLAEAVRADPRSAEGHFNVGRADEEVGRTADAVRFRGQLNARRSSAAT